MARSLEKRRGLAAPGAPVICLSAQILRPKPVQILVAMMKNGLLLWIERQDGSSWAQGVRRDGLEKQRMNRSVDNVQTAADRSREVRELRGVITSELTEVLAEVQRMRSLEEAPAEVDRFVAAAEETLAALHSWAQAGDGRRTIA